MHNTTVHYKGVDIEVEHTYHEGEPSTRDYPGSGAVVDIEDLYIGGVSVAELLDSEKDNIESALLEKLGTY